MRRPQFTLKTLLWLMVCSACFFAGTAWHRQFDKPPFTIYYDATRLGAQGSRSWVDHLVLADGSEWFRVVYSGATPTDSFQGPNGEIISIKPSSKARQSSESVSGEKK
jgi:hypothetical protein